MNVELKCDKCKSGKYELTGVEYEVFPVLYEYKCNLCGCVTTSTIKRKNLVNLKVNNMNTTCSDCKFFDGMNFCNKWHGETSISSPACDEKEVKPKEDKKPDVKCPRCGYSKMDEIWDELGGHTCPKCRYVSGRVRY